MYCTLQGFNIKCFSYGALDRTHNSSFKCWLAASQEAADCQGDRSVLLSQPGSQHQLGPDSLVFTGERMCRMNQHLCHHNEVKINIYVLIMK